MLLAPFLAVVIVVIARERRRALGHAAALLVAAFALIAPITLRNHAVFGEWVPVSINGGLTLWQGVADAGGEAEGAFRRDKLVMAEEAERYDNPRYREWWAEPDGIFRDRERYRRARAVIRAHPLLYARGGRGALEMLSYAEPRAARLSADDAAAELARTKTTMPETRASTTSPAGPRTTAGSLPAAGRAATVVLGAAQSLMVPALTRSPSSAPHHPGRALAIRLLLLALPCTTSDGELLPYEWRVAVPCTTRSSPAPPRRWWRRGPRCAPPDDPPRILPIRTRRDSRSSDTTPCRAGRTPPN
jgi:hypothetical protein